MAISRKEISLQTRNAITHLEMAEGFLYNVRQETWLAAEGETTLAEREVILPCIENHINKCTKMQQCLSDMIKECLS